MVGNCFPNACDAQSLIDSPLLYFQIERNFQFKMFKKKKKKKLGTLKGPFSRAISVAIFLILTHAIERLSHKSIHLYSFAHMI